VFKCHYLFFLFVCLLVCLFVCLFVSSLHSSSLSLLVIVCESINQSINQSNQPCAQETIIDEHGYCQLADSEIDWDGGKKKKHKRKLRVVITMVLTPTHTSLINSSNQPPNSDCVPWSEQRINLGPLRSWVSSFEGSLFDASVKFEGQHATCFQVAVEVGRIKFHHHHHHDGMRLALGDDGVCGVFRRPSVTCNTTRHRTRLQ
jgi:hypothetical protein